MFLRVPRAESHRSTFHRRRPSSCYTGVLFMSQVVRAISYCLQHGTSCCCQYPCDRRLETLTIVSEIIYCASSGIVKFYSLTGPLADNLIHIIMVVLKAQCQSSSTVHCTTSRHLSLFLAAVHSVF